MKYSDQLIAKRNKYRNSLENAKAALSKIKTVMISTQSLKDIDVACYSIDGKSGAGSLLPDLLDKEKSLYNHLNNTVIPGLNSIISDYNYRIQLQLRKEAADAEAAANGV